MLEFLLSFGWGYVFIDPPTTKADFLGHCHLIVLHINLFKRSLLHICMWRVCVHNGVWVQVKGQLVGSVLFLLHVSPRIRFGGKCHYPAKSSCRSSCLLFKELSNFSTILFCFINFHRILFIGRGRYEYVPLRKCGGQRTTCRNQFSFLPYRS